MRPRPSDPVNPDSVRADAWFTPFRFGVFLAVLVVVAHPQVVFGFETFFYRDFSCFGYPLAHYLRESFWRGEVPLWNPLNDCGLPFLAQWNTLALYPFSLFFIVLPLSWSLGVFNLGHLWLAGMGMYLLASRWTGNRMAAAVAGVAFAFSGLLSQALMWPNNIVALGWMPWVALAVGRASREGGRWIIAAGLVGAMQMLSGAPEIILQSWLFIGVVALVQASRKEIAWKRCVAAVGGSALLTAGLAAAQLLPFLDLLAHSQRDTGYAGSLWAMPASGLANYLVPAFHCYQGPYGILGQPDQHWTASYYTGVVLVALAVFTCLRHRDWRAWVLTGLLLFSLGIALGDNGPVYPVFKRILPWLGFMRFPIKFVVLATFVLPLLGALAVGWLHGLPAGRRRNEEKKLFWIGGFLIGGIVLILLRGSSHPGPGENPAFTLQNGVVRAVFLAMILGCLAALRFGVEYKLRVLLRIGLLMLLWLDLAFHAPDMNPLVERDAYAPGNIREFFKWDNQLRAGASRAMQDRASMQKMMLQSIGDPRKDVDGRRLSLFANCNLLDEAPKIDGFYSLELGEAHRLVNGLLAASNGLPALQDLLGVSLVSNPTNPVDWVVRQSAMPMITAGQRPAFSDDEATLREILGNSFDPRRTVYLPKAAETSINATNSAVVNVLSSTFTAHRIDADVEASAPSMVVISQAYYHRWRAYVDDLPSALWRADYALQGVQVPAGRHRLRLKYEDRPFRVGAVISCVTLLASLAGWRVGRKRAPTPAFSAPAA